jgi:hypothetical protein
MEKVRLGFVRIPQIDWINYKSEITRAIGATTISKVLPSLRDGRSMNAVDIICIHREFDEIEANDDEFIQYTCDLQRGFDGKFVREPMRRVEKE